MAKPKKKKIVVELDQSTPLIGKKINLEEAIRLRLRGWSMSEIGTKFGCTKSAVSQQLRKYCPEAIDIEAFKNTESDLIAAKKTMVLNAMTAEKIKEMSAYQLATIYGILTDKQRLLDGKSTQNIHTLVDDAMDLVEKREAERKERQKRQ